MCSLVVFLPSFLGYGPTKKHQICLNMIINWTRLDSKRLKKMLKGCRRCFQSSLFYVLVHVPSLSAPLSPLSCECNSLFSSISVSKKCVLLSNSWFQDQTRSPSWLFLKQLWDLSLHFLFFFLYNYFFIAFLFFLQKKMNYIHWQNLNITIQRTRTSIKGSNSQWCG